MVLRFVLLVITISILRLLILRSLSIFLCIVLLKCASVLPIILVSVWLCVSKLFVPRPLILNVLFRKVLTMKVFSVFDSKAEAYLPPMFFQSRGVAIRSFGAAAADEKHDFSRFAADYTLFELGDFDENSGKFSLLSAPLALGNALELRHSGGD